MKQYLLLAFTLLGLVANSQTIMHIYQSNGTLFQIPTASIDSIRFSTSPPPPLMIICQSNGNTISLSINDIDSITYSEPSFINLPTVTTNTVSNVTPNTALCGGNVIYEGGAIVTERGVCWSTAPNPTTANNKTTDGSGTGSFNSNLIGLLPNTNYYIRSYAKNNAGTAYGNQIIFTTPSLSGTITTLNCGSATNNGVLTANTTASGVSSIVPYTGGNGGAHNGQIVTSTGVTGLTATLAAGTFASGSGNLTYTITGTPSGSGTASFALNVGGKSCTLSRTVGSGALIGPHTCGADSVHNTSLTYGSMTDQDGNVYKTITIGTQTWMAENLKTGRYRNGDPIPVVADNLIFSSITTGASCWYNNDNTTNCPYGRMYNWYAIEDSRNICPTGWHLPTDAEWIVLIDYLGGRTIAGSKMKSIGTHHWQNPNTDATNESGFSGIPGGYRDGYGYFLFLGSYGSWWSSTPYYALGNYCKGLDNSDSDVSYVICGKHEGRSVRCLKD